MSTGRWLSEGHEMTLNEWVQLNTGIEATELQSDEQGQNLEDQEASKLPVIHFIFQGNLLRLLCRAAETTSLCMCRWAYTRPASE